MHRQQRLLHDILTLRRTAPGRRKPAPHDRAQPDRDLAEQPPIGLVVTLPRQAHQGGKIVGSGQRYGSFTYSCARGETLQAALASDAKFFRADSVMLPALLANTPKRAQCSLYQEAAHDQAYID